MAKCFAYVASPFPAQVQPGLSVLRWCRCEPRQHSCRGMEKMVLAKNHIVQQRFEGRLNLEVFAPFMDVHKPPLPGNGDTSQWTYICLAADVYGTVFNHNVRFIQRQSRSQIRLHGQPENRTALRINRELPMKGGFHQKRDCCVIPCQILGSRCVKRFLRPGAIAKNGDASILTLLPAAPG